MILVDTGGPWSDYILGALAVDDEVVQVVKER